MSGASGRRAALENVQMRFGTAICFAALLTCGGILQAAEMRGAYDLEYSTAVAAGDEVQVVVNATYVIYDPSRGASEKVSKTMTQKAFGEEMVDYRAPSADSLKLKLVHSAVHPRPGRFVFRFPDELRPVPGRNTALFFDVTYTASIDGGKKVWSKSHTFAVPFSKDHAPARCLRIERAPNGPLSLNMLPACTAKVPVPDVTIPASK